MRFSPGALALLVTFLPAQGGAVPIALDAALARAAERSPALREAEARLAEARGRGLVARALVPLDPEVEVRFATDWLTSNAGESALEISLGQELELFGQRGLRLDMVGAETKALVRDVDAARLRLRAEVARAFYQLMYEERHVATLHDVVEHAERLADAAERRLASGDLPEVEAALIAVDLAQVQGEADDATASLAIARARLGTLIGVGAVGSVATAGEFPVPPEPAPLSRLMLRARAARPELAGAAQELRARDLEVALRRRERWPNPVLTLGYSRERTFYASENFGPGTIRDDSDVDHFVSLGVRFTLPLLRSSRGQIAQARAHKAMAEARRDAVSAEITDTLTASHARYIAARVQVQRYAALAPRLATLSALADKGYAAGEVDLTVYLATRDRVLRTTAAVLAAQRDAAIGAAELEAAVGGDITEASR